jgi:hypothetical protein
VTEIEGGKERLTVGNHTREKLEIIIMFRTSLLPPRLTVTYITDTAIRSLTSPFSTSHMFAHIVYQKTTNYTAPVKNKNQIF